MQKNGLMNRSRERKVGLWIGGISSFFLLSFFLVPFYLPAGTVPELSGRANAFDYYSAVSYTHLTLPTKNEV